MGKIAVIKALAASQFAYVMSSTTSCSKSLEEANIFSLISFGIKGCMTKLSGL